MKKKAGQGSINKIKTSKFLPSVFQTELNQVWLDSTMDQLVSKGPLKNIDGYVGSKDGKVATASDVYLDSSTLEPAIVSFNKQAEITNIIAFDDVANAINENFKTYNYNSAYSSSRSTFSPPINIDKFTNYINYSWVEELPVYESIYTGSNVNPIVEIQTNNKSIIVDDTNTVTLENQMLIKFTGTGWDTAVRDKTYLIAGSTGKFSLFLYIDENGVRVYNNTVKHSENVDGAWDNNKLFNVEPNTNSSYWNTNATPSDVVANYNNDVNREHVFTGFNFVDFNSNPTQLVDDCFIKFTGSWVSGTNTTDIHKVSIVKLNGEVTITLVPATITEIASIPVLSPPNSLMYDKGSIINPIKDYIVIAKEDKFQTAWSRNNHWVNVSTINKLVDLMPTYDFSEIKDTKRKAIRPIIEYNAGLHMWDQSEMILTTASHKGVIDKAIIIGEEPTTAGTTYIYTDDTDDSIHTVGGSDVPLVEGDTFSVLTSTQSLWSESDGYFTNNKITLAQQKTKTNQYPLYRFYHWSGTAYENINGRRFTGDKIFGYKIGTGANDSELGFPLSYKDTPKGAEYEFENFIITSKYYTTFANAENSRGTYTKDQSGESLFKQNNILKNIYATDSKNAGAIEHVQYKVATADETFTIPYGHSHWRPVQRYIIYSNEGSTSIATVDNTGDITTTQVGNAELLLLGTEQQITFENLTGMTLSLVSHGTTITDDTPAWISIYNGGTTITLATSSASDNTMFDLVGDGEVLQSFVVSKQWDNSFHSLTINGNKIDTAKVTTGSTTIEIDQTAVSENDLIDLYWTNKDLTNKTTNVSLPDVHKHNANNTAMETFTLSETMDHWADKLNAMPGFNGKTFEENNYASIPQSSHYGGTIFMHKDISIMNDINYSSNELSITGALVEQANEFVAFRQRVTAQARRVWKVGAATLQELTDNAIHEVIRNQQDHGLYKESNMLYIQDEDFQRFTLTGDTINDFTKTFKTRFLLNGDVNIRDHVYVYLTEDNGSNTQVRRMLVKDKDYTFIGKTVTLTLDYAAMDSSNTKPVLDVYYSKMDNYSSVPASMVKLGLAYGIEPQVNNNILYTHDGKEIDVTGKDLVDINSSTFDPVNAVIFEMEKRIYAGLVKQDEMYTSTIEGRKRYNSYNKYLPSQHISSWFALTDLNNYLEKHYHKWAKLNNITSINTANYYDAADSFTWNYSSIAISNEFANTTLPGHWKGAYMHLFGTCTPHITPWHMLGYAFKPTWWDANYSWTDATKRAALLNALKKGITEPSTGSQDITFARQYWDFATQCPVTVTGTLEDPSTVLGTPSNIDKEQDFVFGDWGPAEAQWRQSAIGQAVMVDAVLKLNPAKCWTEFFQPSYNIPTYLTSNHYKTPGKIYGKSIEYITVGSSPATLESTGYFKMLDDDQSTIGRAVYKLDNTGSTGSIDAISTIDRGRDFTSQHIISYVGTAGAADDINLYAKLKEIPFVANGIAQAQYNFLIRHSFDTELDNLHNNLTTQLHTKLNGFTSKHLLNISAETSIMGDFNFGADDFKVKMYQGTTKELVTASALTIKKTLTGYTVSGISNNAREFYFYEPNIVNPADYTTQTILNQSVRQYNNFVTTPSIIEYDAELEKLQDVYNFIRGYWKWMETNGYVLQYDGNSSATDFITWALNAEVGNGYILQIGREIKYTPTSGHVYEYNKLEYNSNDILASDGIRLDNTNLGIKRIDGTATIETKDKQFIASVTSAVVNYQHIILFEDKTKLSVNVFNDVKNIAQQRLRITGQKTQDWTGEKKAPGYLIMGDTIVQNFDSAVQSVDDIYRTDVDDFNQSFTKAKELTIGKSEGTLLDDLGINKNVLTNYYQGMIKEKGTKGAIEHIGKSTLLNTGETKVSAYEQYMFRQSTLGNDDMEDPLEIEIVSSDISSSPQTISLDTTNTEANVISATSSKIVNNKPITFETLSYENSDNDILTGGEATFDETKYRVLRMSDIPSVFDSTAAYAKIPTWNSTTSYKKGDQVRHEGQLWNCIVDFTGLTEVSETIQETGTVTYPTFSYGTVATIAGESVTLNKQIPSFSDSVAIGTVVNPTFDDTNNFTINGGDGDANIIFNKKIDTPVVIGPAIILASSNAVLNDVTGKSITINIRHATNGNSNTVIDFDTTPADVVENFTGDGTTDTFTIVQALTGSTYSIDSVTVDGVISTAYTLTGQDIVFTTPPANSAAIIVTLAHVPHQMTAEQIRDKITAAGIANLTCVLETVASIKRLKLSYEDADPENDLVLEPGTLTTNTEIGFITSPVNEQIVAAQDKQGQPISVNMTTQEIVDQINGTNSTALANITASIDGTGHIVITKTNNVQLQTFTFGGSATLLLGLNTSGYVNIAGTINVSADIEYAVSEIQSALTDASITEVTITRVSNAIRITSTGTSVDLGDTIFNSQAGLDTGIKTSTTTNIVNQFVNTPPHFSVVDSTMTQLQATGNDLSLYNILVSDDSEYEIDAVGSINTKYFAWNLFQVQENNVPLYTKPDPVKNTLDNFTTCGICAGSSSKDGNDAEVTTNVAHGLLVGSYVQLLNTTTTPNIDGIHKITKIGADSKVFYIDEYIEKCGNAVTVQPLVTTRFANKEQRTNASLGTVWNLPNKIKVFTNTVTDATLGAEVRGTYVWTLDEYITSIAGVFVIGQDYVIVSPGTTDFTLVGSANNDAGAIFTATGAGTGTGTAKRISWVEVRRNTTRPTNKDIDSVVIYNHAENQAKVQLEAWDPMRKILPGIAQQNIDYINHNDNAIYNTATDSGQHINEDISWGNDQLGTRWWDISKVRYYDYDQGLAVYKSTSWGSLYPGSEVVVWEWIKSTVAPDDYAEAVSRSSEMFDTVATGEAYSVYNSITKETLYYYTTEEEWNAQTLSYNTVYFFWVKNKTTLSDTRSLSAYEVANIIKDPSANGVSWFATISDKEFIVDNINYYIDDRYTVLQINKAGDKYKSHNEWTVITKGSDIIPEYYIDRMKKNLAGRDGATKLKIPFNSLHRFNRYGDDLEIGQAWFSVLQDARRNAIIAINSILKNINLVDEYQNTWDVTLLANNFPTNLWRWRDYELPTYIGTRNHTTTIKKYSDLNSIDRSKHLVARLTLFNNDLQLNRSETYAYNITDSKWELVFKKNSAIEFDVGLMTGTGGWDTSTFDSRPYDEADIAEYWETLIQALYKDIFVHYHLDKMNALFFVIVHYILSTFKQTNWVRKTTYVKLEFVDAVDTKTRKYTKNKINNVLGYINEVKPFHTKSSTVVTKHTALDEANFKPLEQLVINVQTNASSSTHAIDSLTFAHIQNANGTVKSYALTEAKETTIDNTNGLGKEDTTIEVASTANLDNSGVVYIGGELIEYIKHNSTTLNVIKREVAGTYGVDQLNGTSVIQVDDTQLTFANDDLSPLQYNELSSSILDSPGSTLAQELQTFGKGVGL